MLTYFNVSRLLGWFFFLFFFKDFIYFQREGKGGFSDRREGKEKGKVENATQACALMGRGMGGTQWWGWQI